MIDEKILNNVFTGINFQRLADSITETLINDEDFYNKIRDRILNSIGTEFGPGRMDSKVVNLLAERFLNENASNLLSQLNVPAILNSATIKIAKEFATETIKTR